MAIEGRKIARLVEIPKYLGKFKLHRHEASSGIYKVFGSVQRIDSLEDIGEHKIVVANYTEADMFILIRTDKEGNKFFTNTDIPDSDYNTDELILYGSANVLWVRPKDMFFETVEVGGVKTPRFTPVSGKKKVNNN